MIDPSDLFQRQYEDMDPATAEISRLSDQNRELRAVLSDIISCAKRDRSILSKKKSAAHLIETSITKGQVMRAMTLIRDR